MKFEKQIEKIGNSEKKMEQKRAEDRLDMEEARKQERKEDKEELVGVINTLFTEKVKESLAPIVDRTDKVESEQQKLSDRLDSLMEDMKKVKQHLLDCNLQNESVVKGSSDNSSGLSSVVGDSLAGSSSAIGNRSSRPSYVVNTALESQSQLQSIISLARRTVGLQRIDAQDLARMRQRQYGAAQNEDEERLFAVREFLQCEVKLPKEIIQKMKIEKIFPPVSQLNPQWLYVTFENESSVQKIFQKTKIMRKESRIITYIPKEFHSRFIALRDISYKIRHEEECKTRIKMGYMDLHLDKKDKDTGRWNRVKIDIDLPPVELNKSPTKFDSESPAHGRPDQVRQGKRDRESTGSASNNTPKMSRIENCTKTQNEPLKDTLEDSFETRLRKANLVSDDSVSVVDEGNNVKKKDDLGVIISVTSTPVLQPANNQYSASPVFKKSCNSQN